jgi:RsiW-degrading membrane proteinase PrsW (M82 family)
MVSVPLRRDPEAGRRTVGIVLYVLGMLLGGLLLVLLMFFPALFSKNPDVELYSMFVGAVFALPMLLVYLWVPWIVDRYDPEPLWALLLVLAWGGIAGCGFAGLINTIVDATATAAGGKGFGELVGACVSAPLVEEFMKGMGVFFIFYFWRREFDGVVDGVIYATFAALGFAAVENILYYGAAAKQAITTSAGEDAFYGTFLVRGILAPWGHPLYTSMTGIGFGISRETTKTWLKWLAPLGGYMCAAFLHCMWNFLATVLSGLSGLLVVIMFLLWLVFVGAFGILVLFLVRRKGRIIRDHLRDEVLMGNLTPWELDLVTSLFAATKATFQYGGAAGRKFVHAAARLALSKWHTGRAVKGRKLTISADMIFPLRQELFRLRGEVARALGRPVQQPQPWTPGGGPYAQPAVPGTQYASPNPGAFRR